MNFGYALPGVGCTSFIQKNYAVIKKKSNFFLADKNGGKNI